MRTYNYTLALVMTLLGPLAFANDEFQSADVGFKDIAQYIFFEPVFENGNEFIKFSLRNNTTHNGALISTCLYTAKSLAQQTSQIVDPAVRADFKWAFIHSGHSSTSIEKFFPEFQALLKRARPDCAVKDLQPLRDALAAKAG